MDEDTSTAAAPTPYDMAEALRALPLDVALDILRSVADMTGGWTPRLNMVGLLLLKPDAPKGEEVSA